MTNRPVLIACADGSPLSQTAARVVEELARRGVVRRGVGELEPHTEVATLDGCPSACASRRLAAEGHPPRIRIDLAACGVTDETVAGVRVEWLADEVARRLAVSAAPAVLARPRRPMRRMASASPHTHGVNDYLLAVDALTNPVAACGVLVDDVPTLAAHVSDALGVSRPSAGEMLARLEDSGLVRRGPRKELLLTEVGRAAADRATRRHRLLELFAVSVLAYPLAECYERARLLDRSFDEDALERLRRALGERLGDASRCPHGWPIDPSAARAESDSLRSLDQIGRRESVIVARVAENDPSLARLVALGIVPGARVRRTHAGVLEVEGRPVAVDDVPDFVVLVRRA